MESNSKNNKALISAAKAFAKKKQNGIPARIREMLDTLKPGISILINERLSLTDIQEFCVQQKGLKIGIVPLRQYCQENYNYPPKKEGPAKSSSGT